MESREVKVVSGQFDGYKSFQSSASTFGELKSDFNSNDISYVERRILLSQGSVDLVSDEAQLPEGDIHIFIYSKKVESGIGRTVEEFMLEKYNTLRSIASKIGLDVSGSKSQIAERLSEYYVGKTGSNNETEVRASQADLDERLAAIEAKIDRVIEIVGESDVTSTESGTDVSDADAEMMARYDRLA
jgi:hypothetical protein